MPDDRPVLPSSASACEIAIGADDLESLDRGEARRRRVERLRTAQDAASVSGLIESLSDSDWRVRRSAAAALALDPSEDRSELLIDLLYSEDAGERNAAIKALIKSGSDSVGALVRALGSAEADVRNFAALALGQIGDPAVHDELVSLLDREEDENVRSMIIEALGRIGHEGAVPVLQSILAEGTMESAAAAEALGSLGLTGTVGSLVSALRDDPVGAGAADALGRIGDIRALLPLVRSCEGASPGYLGRAIVAIAAVLEQTDETTGTVARALRERASGEMPAELMEALVTQLELPGPGRLTALKAASWLGPADIAPCVFRAAQESESIDIAVAFVAERIESVRVHFDAAETSAYPTVRSVLARALGLAADPLEAPRLLRLAHDVNACVRVDAIEALGSSGRQECAAPLVDMLGDRLVEIREAAIESLSLLGIDGVIPELAELAERGGEEARTAVARVLSVRLGLDDGHDARLAFTLARDPSPAVRAAAVPAVGSIPGHEAAAVLLDLVLDSDRCLRFAALRALAGRPEEAARSALRAAVRSDDRSVVAAAVRGLAEDATRLDIETIAATLGDAAPVVTVTALAALSRCRAVDRVQPVVGLTVHPLADVREAALRALRALDPQAGCEIAALVLCGSEESWQVRLAAAETLRECGSQEAIPALERALCDDEPLVRRAAVAAVPGAFEDDAVDRLLSMWDDGVLRDPAIAALSGIGDGAVEAVVAFMDGAPDPALDLACTVLGRIGSRVSVGHLLEVLTSGSSRERWYALLGLHRSQAAWAAPGLAPVVASEADETIRTSLAAVAAHLASFAQDPS